MDLKIAARMVAVLALGAAMTAAVMALRGDGPGDGTEDVPAQTLRHPGGEPARSELTRCRDLGMAAADDAACRKAWAENRRRFFGGGKPDRPAIPKPERFGSVPPPVRDTDATDEPSGGKASERRPSAAPAAVDETDADAEEAAP